MPTKFNQRVKELEDNNKDLLIANKQHLEDEIKDFYYIMNETESDGEKGKKIKKLHRQEQGILLS